MAIGHKTMGQDLARVSIPCRHVILHESERKIANIIEIGGIVLTRLFFD